MLLFQPFVESAENDKKRYQEALEQYNASKEDSGEA